MSPQHTGDMIDASAYSVDELREAVFGAGGRVSRPLALALLVRKNYPGKVSDLQKVLVDEAEQPRMRALAASALGQIRTPASLRALEKVLSTSDGVTLCAVSGALAEVGDKKHVPALRKLTRSQGPVGRAAERALNVIGRRLKLSVPRIAEIKPLLIQATGESTPIQVVMATASDVTRIVKMTPTRKLARRGALSMTCQGRQLVFVFDDASLGQGIGMFRQRGDVGIVAEPPGIEGKEWSTRYHVSVEPTAKTTFRILVTTRNGRPRFAGYGTEDGGVATFEIAAADAPGAVPIDLRGTFDGKKLTFSQARSGVWRRPSSTPSAETPSDR